MEPQSVHLLSKSQKSRQPWPWSQVVEGGASGQQLVHLWPRGWDPTGGPGSWQQWMGTRVFHKQREISRDKAHTLRRQFPIIVSKQVNEPRVMKGQQGRMAVLNEWALHAYLSCPAGGPELSPGCVQTNINQLLQGSLFAEPT